MRRLVAMLLLIAGPACAQGVEPPRGSALRGEVLDAVRVVAEQDLGPPVEFIVTWLRVDGDVAFARLDAQRPGGGAIDIPQIPLVTKLGVPPDMIDGPRVEAFLRRTATGWQVIEHATGATDVWWFGYDCAVFAGVQPVGSC